MGDQDSLKAAAQALQLNADSAVEVWRFQTGSGLLGAPTEEALYELMKVNKKIQKLGCTLNNPGYRDNINRAMLRNGDAARRARRGGAGATAVKKPLKKVLLDDPPESACFDVFPTEDDKLLKAREYLAEQKAVPSSTVLQNHMKKVGCALKFSEVGPFLKDIQTKLLSSAKGREITCVGPTGDETKGVVNASESANKQWKIEIT